MGCADVSQRRALEAKTVYTDGMGCEEERNQLRGALFNLKVELDGLIHGPDASHGSSAWQLAKSSDNNVGQMSFNVF